MNLLNWIHEGFSVRATLYGGMINLLGETKPAVIHEPDDAGWVLVEVEGRERRKIHLEYMSKMQNGWMIQCDQSEPSGLPCVLIIPRFQKEEEEEEEEA